MFSDPLKGPIAARKVFWPLRFQNQVLIPAVEASTEGILGNKKCFRLVKYKQLQKRSTKRLTHAFWQSTTQLAIFSQATRIFRASSKLVFTEYCAIIRKRRAVYFVSQ